MPNDHTSNRVCWQRALDALPLLPRTIFALHAWDELSFSEIAHRTGLSTEEVEEHFARALLHLDFQVGTIFSRAVVARCAQAD